MEGIDLKILNKVILLTIIVVFLAGTVGISNVGLLYTPWKTYKEVKSKLTIGFSYFASFFLYNRLTTLALIIPLILPVIPSESYHSDFGILHINCS